MKKNILLIIMLFNSVLAFSNEVKVKILNVKTNEGKITLSIHSSKESFKKHIPEYTIVLESSDSEIETIISLPDGEYAFCIFQDLNNDNKLNTNLVGIPKEPFGFSNYNGSSVPGNFEKHKVNINKDTEVSIALFKYSGTDL